MKSLPPLVVVRLAHGKVNAELGLVVPMARMAQLLRSWRLALSTPLKTASAHAAAFAGRLSDGAFTQRIVTTGSAAGFCAICRWR